MTQLNNATDTFPDEIFKAYDIRGIVDSALTTTITRQIGQAFGSEALSRGVDSVIIARDGRLSGPALSTALSEGLRASGCDVIDVGMVPTPTLYFATYELGTGTGIMITGSHNPRGDNGVKIVLNQQTIHAGGIEDIRDRVIGGDLWDSKRAQGAGPHAAVERWHAEQPPGVRRRSLVPRRSGGEVDHEGRLRQDGFVGAFGPLCLQHDFAVDQFERHTG